MPVDSKLKDFMDSVNKEHGEGSVIKGDTQRSQVDAISTGSLLIDIDTGIGGIPRGRITEVFGEEMSGKTTLSLHATSNTQKDKGRALFVDTEHALSPTYATQLGVNLDELVVSQPDNAEQGLEIVKAGLLSGAFTLITIDSIASLVPRAAFEGQMGDALVGVLARLMSKALGQFAKFAADSNTALLCLNQMRSKIGVTYGDPMVTCGGGALKFYSSLRMRMYRGALNKDGEDVLGTQTKVKIIKNKFAAPFKECEPALIYGEGFSRELEVLDLGVTNDLIQKAGSWYSYKSERLGNGKDAVRQFLMANPAITKDIETQIRAIYGVA